MTLRSRENNEQVFFERLAIALNAAEDWDSVMLIASRLLTTEFQLKSVIFGLADQRRELFDIRQFFRHSIPYDTKILWENTGLYSVFENVQSLRLADSSQMPDSKPGDAEIMRDFPGAVLAVPLQSGQGAMGILALLRGKNVSFTEVDEQKVTAAAALISLLWSHQKPQKPEMNWDSGDFWQHMFQNLMDGISEPLVIASDTTDLIYHSNLAFQALTGLSEEVVHGMPWTSLHPIPKRSVNSTDEFETEIILPRRNGAPVSAIVHCKPLVEQPEKVLAIYYPVPTELTPESEVSPKDPPLEATEPFLPVGQLLHDLKTPLSAVKGFSQLILDMEKETLPGDVVHFARRIYHNGLLLEQLLEELQRRRYQGKRKMSPAVPIRHVMQQVVDNVAFLLEQYPVTVDMPETWPVIPGYELDLVRLWTNLVINAIRCVSSSPAPVVRLSWQPADDGYRFEIFNNGPAIPEKELPYIFSAAAETSAVNAGMDANWGVGLSIVHTIVQQHLGRVWVESRPNGVHFYFILPAGKPGARQED